MNFRTCPRRLRTSKVIRSGLRNWFLLFVIPFCAGTAIAAPHAIARSTRVIPLGCANGMKLYCRVAEERDLTFAIGDGQSETISLAFVGDCKGRKHQIVLPQVHGFTDCGIVEVNDYVHAGRKQVFIGSSYGADVSNLYDFDGHSAHTLYTNDYGRVGARPVWLRRLGWRLEEEWPRSQFTDSDEDLGVGIDIGGNCVQRYLHWNGKAFVPDRPGSSEIVKSGSLKAEWAG